MMLMRADYLIQWFPVAENEIYRAHNKRFFEVMAASVVVESVLLPKESTSVEGIKIARCSQRDRLLLSSSDLKRWRVLSRLSG